MFLDCVYDILHFIRVKSRKKAELVSQQLEGFLKRDMKFEEFINLRQGNMSNEDYSLNFTLFPNYVKFFLSNPREKFSRFVTSVYDIMKEY